MRATGTMRPMDRLRTHLQTHRRTRMKRRLTRAIRTGLALAAGLGLGLGLAAPAQADVIEVPAWTPPPPVSAPGSILGPIAGRFDPTDVAAAPLPSGLLAPAPPAFDRFSCDTFTCGRNGGLGVIESPVTPGTLPGDLPGD